MASKPHLANRLPEGWQPEAQRARAHGVGCVFTARRTPVSRCSVSSDSATADPADTGHEDTGRAKTWGLCRTQQRPFPSRPIQLRCDDPAAQDRLPEIQIVASILHGCLTRPAGQQWYDPLPAVLARVICVQGQESSRSYRFSICGWATIHRFLPFSCASIPRASLFLFDVASFRRL